MCLCTFVCFFIFLLKFFEHLVSSTPFFLIVCVVLLQQLKHALGPDKPGIAGNGRVSWCRWAASHALSDRGRDCCRSVNPPPGLSVAPVVMCSRIMKVLHCMFLHLKHAFSILFLDGDQMESMDTVSLQAVTLADGSTAYIQHDSKASFSDGQIMDGQVIQLEDGSAAYVQHVTMPKAGKCDFGVRRIRNHITFTLLDLKGCQ